MTFVDGSKRSFDEMTKKLYGDEHQLQFTDSNKKIKLKEVNYSKYKTGNIISIELQNIMVYTKGKFMFDSNLNMILGANGSGKSTVLCSINIVLDGSLANIGRASEMDHFIKKDCDQGAITITLKSDYNVVSKIFSETELSSLNIKPSDQTVRITRRLYRFAQKSSKKYDYYINGKKIKTDSAVKLLVKGFNIQLDNLTQFLSQERAREFSNLNQKELLKTTLKSISLDTYNEWNSLSEVETNKNRLAHVITEQQRKLDEANEEKTFLEKKVEENERYSKLQTEIKQYDNLLALVKYDEIRKGTQKAEEDYEKCVAAFESKSNELKKILKSEKIYSKIKDKVNDEITQFEREAREHVRSTSNNNNEINSWKHKANEEIANLKHFDSIKRKYEIECQKYRTAIEDIEKQISEFVIEEKSHYDQWKQDRLKIGANRRNLDGELQEETNFITSLKRKQNTAEFEIKKLQNSLTGKDPLLKLDSDDQKRFRTALDAASQKGFKDDVLPPAVACLEVVDDRYADFMNVAISKNTSLAVTFATSEAKNAMGKFISSNLGLNTYLLEKTPVPSPPISIEQLKKLGFDGYASDFLEGHSKVRKMVIEKNRLYRTPVRMNDLDQIMIDKLKRLVDNNGRLIFNQVFAGRSSYKFIKSKYDGQVSVSSFTIQSGRHYRKTGSIVLDDLKKQTQESIANINKSIERINGEIVERENKINVIRIQLLRLSEEGNEIVEKIKKYEIQTKIHSDLHRQKERFEKNLENAKKKVEEFSDSKTQDMKAKVIKNVLNFKINQSLAILKPIKPLAEDAAKSFYSRQKKRLILQSLENEQLLNQGETGVLQREYKELERQLAEAKEFLDEVKNDDARKSLEKRVSSFSKQDIKALKHLAASIDPLTTTAVATALRSKNSELQGLHFDDESENRLKEISHTIKVINAELPKLQAAFDTASSEFAARDGALKNLVETTVNGISEKFESLFKNVGCKGKVTLSDLSQPYKDWEIEIQVAFRLNAQMQKLSGKTHSGGEQSVSTMLYLISLQRYTKAPFTVIDEINQGMDANNERKIHEILVKETCSSNEGEGAQYILITPKLLTNLYYDYGMQCNIIFAGLEMPDVDKDSHLLNLGAAPMYELPE